MAEDCTDGDYLGAYSRFFAEFIARVNPNDQLPVSVSACNVTEGEIVGEIISVTLQYLNQTHCPPSLQAHLVHQVIQEIKSLCKKQPEDCGYKSQERTYAALKLMQAITGKVNEICTRYLDNSRLALLPPPPSTPLPQVIGGGSRNCRRKMEDRYVILHDLHSTFGIQDDSIANYYAVFDGHGGQDAAVYCATHLHQYLVESKYYPTDPERALRDAFLTTDAKFIEKSKTQKVCGGTTAVCTLVLNKKLYVSWVGDSTAILVKGGNSVTNLVDPHRLNRIDEVQRIQRMGGVVFETKGIPRVNGVLSVSRAIGDVQYKPFVTAEPEIKCVNLDGTEDFLIIASDGLSDVLKPKQISAFVHLAIKRNPNPLKRAHQSLLYAAKRARSEDNITAIVVLFTPPNEIAEKNSYSFCTLTADGNLKIVNPKDHPFFLDMEEDQHDTHNPSIFKSTMFLPDTPLDDVLMSSNGKHENGDADYDYSDLGPETDVDAVDDVATVPVKNLSYEFYRDDEEQVEKDARIRGHDKKAANIDNKMIVEHNARSEHEKYVDNDFDVDRDPRRVEVGRIGSFKDEDEEDDVREVDAGSAVDYDDTPPSPQAIKPLQHAALISEVDNVADSEDSEDEWNFYRVDPNKEKESTTSVDEPTENKSDKVSHGPEAFVEDNSSEIQSPEIKQDIKCESPKKEVSSELIDTEISAEDELIDQGKEELSAEDKQESRDMDFQLNPDAAEFVPVSPQMMGNRRNLVEDYPISGSPLKQVPQMDDIQVPSESEFEEEVCRRPREVEDEEKECPNGDHFERTDYADFLGEKQKALAANLDISEISSTKAEFGDESSTSSLTGSQFHRTNMSLPDDSFSSGERDYDIAKDPMAMSFTPSDFKAAFDKEVDLNAVHVLRAVDLDEKNGTMEDDEEEEEDEENETPELCLKFDILSLSDEHAASKSSHIASDSSDIVNKSSDHEDDECTFIEHTDKPKATGFMEVESDQYQSSNLPSAEISLPENSEHHDVYKLEESPMTDNYSAELESTKEAVSTDNEQLLMSPSSADIDEFKPIDEAALSPTDSQKEICMGESDTPPSSLSPVPDAIECSSPRKENDFVSTIGESPVPLESAIDSDLMEEFQSNRDNFNLFSSNLETPNNTFGAAFQENMMRDVDIMQPVSVKESKTAVLEAAVTETVPEQPKENLLDFGVELETDSKSPMENMIVEPTPPLTPQEIGSDMPQNIGESASLFEPWVRNEVMDDAKPEETMKSDICEFEAQKEATPYSSEMQEFETRKETATLNLSESLQEFTGLEKQLQPEDSAPVESTVLQAEPQVAMEDSKCTLESKESVEAISKDDDEKLAEENLIPQVLADSKEPEKNVEETIAVTAAAATAVAAAAGVAAVQSKAKAKPATKSTKTSTQSKAAPKSSPTSPSKSASSTTRGTTTAAASKKPTSSASPRPRDLDASKKPALLSSTASKTSASKPASTLKPATATATKTTARTNLSATKPKAASAVSSAKPSSSTTDKKPTANGDVKPISKTSAAKASSRTTVTGTTSKTSLVKTSASTRTSNVTTTTKTRPASAATNTTKSTTRPSTITSTTTSTAGATRPKTAPSTTSNATKLRTSTASKSSPIIDKQVKETANKQISLGRTSTSSTPKTTRTTLSTSNSTTTTTTSTVKRTSNTRATTLASSPTKKTSTTKASARTSSLGSKTSSTSKVKVVQNGVSEKIAITNTTVTSTKTNLEDDVPKKDLSPVVAPTDNQLIMNAD